MKHILIMPVHKQLSIHYFDWWIEETFELVYLHGNFAVVEDGKGIRHFLQATWVKMQIFKDKKIVVK